jgi:hypothetical protein
MLVSLISGTNSGVIVAVCQVQSRPGGSNTVARWSVRVLELRSGRADPWKVRLIFRPRRESQIISEVLRPSGSGENWGYPGVAGATPWLPSVTLRVRFRRIWQVVGAKPPMASPLWLPIATVRVRLSMVRRGLSKCRSSFGSKDLLSRFAPINRGLPTHSMPKRPLSQEKSLAGGSPSVHPNPSTVRPIKANAFDCKPCTPKTDPGGVTDGSQGVEPRLSLSDNHGDDPWMIRHHYQSEEPCDPVVTTANLHSQGSSVGYSLTSRASFASSGSIAARQVLGNSGYPRFLALALYQRRFPINE